MAASFSRRPFFLPRLAVADHYEDDTVDGMGYVAPAVVAEKLASLVRLDGQTVLDAGCGTGLAGVELSERASALIDGMDISPDMLALARKRARMKTCAQQT